MTELNNIFNQLWRDYTEQNPAVQKVYDLFIKEGEKVVNDHIAFRTYNDPRINIEVLSGSFLAGGYVEKGQYHFEEKKLFAKHFELPEKEDAPRVFISELLVEEFSPYTQETVKEAISRIPEESLKSEGLIYAGNCWGMPSYETYLQLRSESEYAAWVYVFGFRANHFTVSVNNLKKYSSASSIVETVKNMVQS